jgi:hypothetical protein
MSRKTYSTLVKAAENLTQAELFLAPELPSLVALDANLLATMNLLELHNPFPDHPRSENPDIADGVEEHIFNSIFILANALRRNLSAYYAVIQESCDDYQDQQEVSF